MLLRVYIFQSSSEKDALALGEALRFYDVCSALSFRFRLKVRSKLQIISWEVPGKREVIILFGIFPPHFHEILGKQILARKGVHPRKMINFLMMFHFHEDFGSNCPVSPPDIPLRIARIRLDLPLQLLAHLRHHLVLAVYLKRTLPQTFMTNRSNLTTLIQFGANLGKINCGAVSSLSASLSWFFLFIPQCITYTLTIIIK